MHRLQLHLSPSSIRIPVFLSHLTWNVLLDLLQNHFSGKSIYLVGDANVLALYETEIRQNLENLTGFRKMISFPPGEKNKSRKWRDTLENVLLQDHAGRDSLLLAMGGGVTGDLVGFVAASLYRGISLIHLPTSLIAQVDSSIGGKVGINHPQGKNLLGSFHQPQAIFIGTSFLQTLPRNEFSNGMAEVIKYAVLLDPELWDRLDEEHKGIMERDPELLESMVQRSVELKIQVVEKDEKESEYRSILNFGHTVGHAIEQLSHYRIKHGFAVASGMLAAAALSRQLFDYPEEKIERLRHTLKLYRLTPVSFSRYAFPDIWHIIQSDKKARERTPRFSLLDDRNQPRLFQTVSQKELRYALESC
jgi:3-dehydroquinate synthase